MLGTPLGVILVVLVTIGVVIAVSLWLLTLPISQLSGVELVKVKHLNTNVLTNYYEINIEIYNYGTRDVCIIHVLVNGKPYDRAVVDMIPDPKDLVIEAGRRIVFSIRLDKNHYFPGQSVEIDIRFSIGGSHKLYVSLP